MDIKMLIFWIYVVFGILLILFSRPISNYIYKIILVFTNKANMDELFLFKVDKKNKETMFTLARFFVLIFGILIASFSTYYIYFK